MPVVIEHQVDAAAAPASVFAYLHDPERRGEWDVSADGSTVEGGSPAAGARLHVHGRRMAPSWVGEYTRFEPPTRSSVRLVEGEGMPFRSFTQTIAVAPRGGGATVTIRLEYEATGVVRLIEPLTLRHRLRKVTQRSLGRIRDHFA